MNHAASEPATTHSIYDAWKAPQGDGELLVWPPPRQLLQDAVENGKRLRGAAGVLIQNVPLPEIRQQFREFIGEKDHSLPLVATGHQTELHHPGVWVKNALIDAAATRLGGRALHFAVDTDAPKHLSLRWPGAAAPLTDDAGHAGDAWSGRLDPPTPAHLAVLARQFDSAAKDWKFHPLVPDFLASLRRLSLESLTLSSALTGALHELDWNLGLRQEAMLVSPLCTAEPYLAFVHHVLARADVFAADYNASLEEYRSQHKIRTVGRPMPNLRSEPEICEVPFWLDDLSNGSRSRAHVLRALTRGAGGRAWTIASPRPDAPESFAFDPAADAWQASASLLDWLRRNNLRLSPRALTLTSVLRLLVADQFVHGIGGGQYDQVADTLIRRHFGISPPRFAVTTATLYFPGAADQPRVCVPCVRQEGRRLRHSILGQDKRLLVAAIAAAPRGSAARMTLFHDMHHKLAAAAAAHPAFHRWEEQLAETERREQQEQALFDRELFYAIQPRERLTALIDKCRSAFE